MTNHDELQLLENVELRLAMCNTDAQLERCIQTFLAPVLLKLATPHDDVRKKVMEILAHVNKRIKTNTSIQLPFQSLLAQYTNDSIPMIVKNFAMIYIEMSAQRMTDIELAKSIPDFLRGIAQKPATLRTSALHLALPVLRQWSLEPGKQEAARQEIFSFDSRPADLKIVLDFFTDILLYQLPTIRRQESTPTASPVYPGLSPAAVEAVTNKGKRSWTLSDLTSAKLGVIHFILSHVFTDNERLPLLIIGASDPNQDVASASEDGMRRWTGNIDLESHVLIKALYSLCLGTKPVGSEAGANTRTPCSIALKIRILNYLTKSIIATNMTAQMIQVVFDGIYGESSTPKLRRSAMSFLQWTARMCTYQSMAKVAPVLISGLLKYIDQNPVVNDHEGEIIKGFAYVSCGLVIKKVPELATQDLDVLSRLFDSLESEPTNLRVYVQDALSYLIDIYAGLDESDSVHDRLQEIILKAVQANNASRRFMAIKYANTIYPFSSVFARYICLLGLSNTVTKLEVKEEAMRGLRPFDRSDTRSTITSVPASVLPSFADLVAFLHTHRPSDEYLSYSKSPVILGYPAEVYSSALNFVRMILVLQANPTTIMIDGHVESTVENVMEEDSSAINNVKAMIHGAWTESGAIHQALTQWIDLLQHALTPDFKDSDAFGFATKYLLEVISLGPLSMANLAKDRLGLFKQCALSDKLMTRQVMSHIVGLVGSSGCLSDTEINSTLNEWCDLITYDSSSNMIRNAHERHGAILSIGYLVGRCHYQSRPLSPDTMHRCIQHVVAYLDGAPTVTFYQLAGAACQALAEMGRLCPLPLAIVAEQKENEAEDSAMDVDRPLTLNDVIHRLIKCTKTCKDSAVQEKALFTLGHLCVPLDKTSELVTTVVDAVYATADTKKVDLFFAGGEVWCMLMFGWHSLAMQKFKDMSDIPGLQAIASPNTNEEQSSLFQRVIEKIVQSYVASDRAWYRKAACIWLLSLIKFGGQDQVLVMDNLAMIHTCFSRLLDDRDEFTQEVASKGLGLVYEYGDVKLREDLLYSLVGAFTEGHSIRAQSITDNTVLFEQESLGSTPDGGSISTYKELCSLASELNQPDLIYKFLNLANHNALWTSRRGAGFGFQHLATLAEKEMKPYLPVLIPKLYRYQFDPHPAVNQSMKSIWQALIKDKQKTVDAHFDAIMQDILTNLGNRQWRLREASANAVTDLIQGRRLAQIEPYLEKLWTMCMRVVDDIKGSVRQAGTMACKSLIKFTIHYCDPTVVSTSDGEKVMTIVMPFLLEKGLQSDADDVRAFSLEAVLSVCKTGANLLKPYIAELVDTLLQLLSSLEPQTMNYLSFHVDKYNITQEQLDHARLSGARNSPMMEGVEHCMPFVDESVMQVLTPRIIHLIKKGTGLPTKAGTARFIVMLCMQRRDIMRPVADTLLKTLSGAICSKNAAVRKSFATATGYVCQLATLDRLGSLARHLQKLYIEHQDEDARSASAVTVVEITRSATDRANDVASQLVPLIFFGKHDPDTTLNELWKEAWEHLTAGTTSRVALYADEIISFLEPLLSSPSWSVKQTAALTLADMCTTAGEGIRTHVDRLMPVMVSTLSTRSWAGKEHVLAAFVELCKAAPTLVSSNHVNALEILIREGKRKNRTYQRHALVALKKFLDTFGSQLDMQSIVQPFLRDLCQLDENDIESEESDLATPLLLAIKANAFEAIATGFQPRVFASQVELAFSLCEVLTHGLEHSVWSVQIAMMHGLNTFVERMDSSLSAPLTEPILQACFHALKETKYVAVRTAAVDIFEVMSPHLDQDHQHHMVQNLRDHLQYESVPLLQERLRNICGTHVTSHPNGF